MGYLRKKTHLLVFEHTAFEVDILKKINHRLYKESKASTMTKFTLECTSENAWCSILVNNLMIVLLQSLKQKWHVVSAWIDQRRSSRNSAPNTASSKMDLQSNNPQYKQRMYCRRQILKQSTNKTISLTHCVFNSATKASTASRLRKFVVLYS